MGVGTRVGQAGIDLAGLEGIAEGVARAAGAVEVAQATFEGPGRWRGRTVRRQAGTEPVIEADTGEETVRRDAGTGTIAGQHATDRCREDRAAAEVVVQALD